MNRLFLMALLFLGITRAFGTIEVSLPLVTGNPGDTLDIPVLTTAIPDSSVLACQFTLGYSPNVITVLDIVSDGTMVGQPGWSAAVNIAGDSVTVGAFGSGFLKGAGTVVKVRCIIKGTVGSTTGLIFRQFTYNAGSPNVTTRNGGISVVTGLGEPASGVPVATSLSQNFPNPFNPNSDIRYQISEFGTVTLTVYDLLGREVVVLVNEEQAPGSYQVRFDATGLPSGIYYYRLQAGGYTDTKKMALVR